jgi:hypothetical protein
MHLGAAATIRPLQRLRCLSAPLTARRLYATFGRLRVDVGAPRGLGHLLGQLGTMHVD